VVCTIKPWSMQYIDVTCRRYVALRPPLHISVEPDAVEISQKVWQASKIMAIICYLEWCNPYTKNKSINWECAAAPWQLIDWEHDVILLWFGVQGSKGAVSIRMDVYGVSMCFVNVHFRAHRENYNGRVLVSIWLSWLCKTVFKSCCSLPVVP